MEQGQIIDTSLLIDGELGLTTIFNVIEYPPASEFCDFLFPNDEDYKKALDLGWKLRKIGKPIGCIDIINAAICINRNLKFITRDKDYEKILLVEPGFKLKLFN